MSFEVLRISGYTAISSGDTVIRPRHIYLAIKEDAELKYLARQRVVLGGGVLPYISPGVESDWGVRNFNFDEDEDEEEVDLDEDGETVARAPDDDYYFLDHVEGAGDDKPWALATVAEMFPLASNLFEARNVARAPLYLRGEGAPQTVDPIASSITLETPKAAGDAASLASPPAASSAQASVESALPPIVDRMGFRDPINEIHLLSIRALAARAGITRISSMLYEEVTTASNS